MAWKSLEHAGELRQHEREKEDEHAGGGQQQKAGIAQRVENAPPQRLGARALGRQRLQHRRQHRGLFGEPRERDEERRKRIGPRAERLGETLPGEHSVAQLGGDGAHTAKLAVAASPCRDWHNAEERKYGGARTT